MKTYHMSYEELEEHSLNLARQAEEYAPTEVIAIARKGLIPAFIVANYLRLKVGFWYPTENRLCSFQANRLLFVDDMVALGHTLIRLRECFPDMDYRLATIFVDAECPHRPDYYSFVATDWVIFPFMTGHGEIPGERQAFRHSADYCRY